MPDRDPGRAAGARLSEAVDRAKAAGADVAEAVDFDVVDTDRHLAFADDVFGRFGDIDLVIVAAGVLGDQGADELDPAAAATVITTNFAGPASALLAVGRPTPAPGTRPPGRAVIGGR